MEADKEIRALLLLMDDPDEEVYGTVVSRLLHYGNAVIPALESFWELSSDNFVQERIEQLIDQVYFEQLTADFEEWASNPQPELLKGAILVARFQYPQLNIVALQTHIDQIRRNVWLELNSFLTPYEQINVINSILFNFYKLHGHELTERNPKHFFLNQLLESRQGNGYSIGVLYLAICEQLDIPIFAMNVPRQFVFGYIYAQPTLSDSPLNEQQRIHFYVDPMSGAVFSQNDIEAYLKKINAPDRNIYMAPLLNKRIIYKMLEELRLCYMYQKDEKKAGDIHQLMQIIS